MDNGLVQRDRFEKYDNCAWVLILVVVDNGLVLIVGYHDAHPIKPHPAPMLKALELMNEKAEDVLSFGDRAIDMIAAKKAGIKAIACLWGTKERSMLLGTAYDQAISSPLEILPYLQ